MKKYFLMVLITLWGASVYAYDGQPIEQIEAFFKEMPTDSSKAIDNLYASNPAMQVGCSA